MLGKGLESLIPNKNNQSGGNSDDFANQQQDTDEMQYEGEAVSRQERDTLGILGSLGRQNTEIVIERHEEQYIPEQPLHQRASAPRSSEALRGGESDQRQSAGGIPMISGPVFQVETSRITINPYQPRKVFDEAALDELAASIREFGIIQPLVVSKTDEETDTGVQSRYQLIAGHRRLLAAKKAGLRTVPVVVRNFAKKTEALEIAILENIQRQDLNIIETARAYARLSDEFNLTQREIAVRLGKSRESVANALRLLSLPSEIQDSLSKGEINESHARILMQIPDIQRQKELHRRILHEGLSVRDISKYRNIEISKSRNAEILKSQNKESSPQDVQLKQLERNLSEFLGAPVRVEVSENGGKIIIHFYSPEEAMGIAQKIHPEEL